jgi:hypothetical protein
VRGRLCAAFAAVAYLAVVLWTLSDLAVDPTAYLLGSPRETPRAKLGELDQAMVLGTVTRNARVLLERPWDLRGVGQCYPLPRPFTLGEHMFGSGLLAAVPFAIIGDPIASYNAMLGLTLWIPALAMYALAFHFTRDPAGAFVAGMLFAFSRDRLIDPSHPYAHGDLWMPVVLLFLHRTFVRPSWKNALGLAAFATLSLGESLYPLLAGTVLGGVYGISLLARHRHALAKRVVPLGLACALIAAAATFVFGPYLQTAAEWGILQARFSIFWMASMWAPGHSAFPGWILVGLAAVALVDRVRKRRTCEDGEDPRLPIALGGLLVWWCSIYALPLPGLALPSPLILAGRIIPGLDSVRALANVGMGVTLSLAFLAAYAVGALAGRRVLPRIALAAAASFALLFEQFDPGTSMRSFGARFDLVPYRAAPPPEDIALFARADVGAVLDIPLMPRSQFLRNAHALLVSAYHGRPTAACYNSFGTSVADQMAELAQAVPQAAALDALAAHGFGTIIVHKDRLFPKQADWLLTKFAEVAGPRGRLEEVGRSKDHVVYRLKRTVATTRFPVLAPDRIDPPHRIDGTGEATIPFVFRNDGPIVFRHPDPIAPSEIVLQWHRRREEAPRETRSRAMLPLALGRGVESTIAVASEIPVAPGTYVVELLRALEPNIVLSRRIVEIVDPGRSSS